MTSQGAEKPSTAELAQLYRELADKFLADVKRLREVRDEAVATGTRLLEELEEGMKAREVNLDYALRDELIYVVSYLGGNGSVFEFDLAEKEAKNIAALAAAVAERNT
jgi:hypothetical protein